MITADDPMTEPAPSARLVSMVRVICPASELDEDGIVLRVGQTVSRWAAPNPGAFFGDALDDSEWLFDLYAEGGPSEGAVVLTGRIDQIEALFVCVTLQGGDGWRPIAGRTRRQAIPSTADTVRPEPRIRWTQTTEPDAEGVSYSAGYDDIQEGDERFDGWLITLKDASIEA